MTSASLLARRTSLECGARDTPGQVRTCDLSLRRRALYPLSYGRFGRRSLVASAPVSTIAFFPEGAYGPTNNCVGIGDVLRRRGHRVVFIVEESFAGHARGAGIRGAADAARRRRRSAEEEPGQFWKDFIRDTAPVFRKPTIEQLGEFIAPTFQALVDGARYVDDRLREIIDELEPDVIVEDNVVSFPALPACGRPWVRIVLLQPRRDQGPRRAADVLRLPGRRPDAAGTTTGTSTARTHAETARGLRRVLPRPRRARRCPTLEFMHESPYLNLYLYPDEVDYARARRRSTPRWHNLRRASATTDAPWEPPAREATARWST